MKTENEIEYSTAQINEQEQITGAEALLECLIAEGVETVFGYPGGAIMPVYDKLLDYSDKINHILTRHEQGAAHAAQAFSMVTRKPGVCFATPVPRSLVLVSTTFREAPRGRSARKLPPLVVLGPPYKG